MTEQRLTKTWTHNTAGGTAPEKPSVVLNSYVLFVFTHNMEVRGLSGCFPFHLVDEQMEPTLYIQLCVRSEVTLPSVVSNSGTSAQG